MLPVVASANATLHLPNMTIPLPGCSYPIFHQNTCEFQSFVFAKYVFSKYHLTLFSRATKVITDSWVALEDEEDEEGDEEDEETDVESDGGVEEVFELF